MSRTTLYGSNKEGELLVIDEYNNSHRSAAMLWGWICVKGGLSTSPYSSDWDKIWRTDGFAESLPEDEWWVLMSTYDRFVLPRKHRLKMAESMRSVHLKLEAWKEENHVSSSFEAQAEDLEEDKDSPFFAWNQTSVGEAWPEIEDGEDENGWETYRPHNLLIDGDFVLIKGFHDLERVRKPSPLELLAEAAEESEV